MNVTEKITRLRELRHWNLYQLAQHSGVPLNTISSWYNKNLQPSLDSLFKICKAFDITMSDFFLEEHQGIEMTAQDLLLVRYASRLAPDEYASLLQFLSTLHSEQGNDPGQDNVSRHDNAPGQENASRKDNNPGQSNDVPALQKNPAEH